jgi:hypothetical protein
MQMYLKLKNNVIEKYPYNVNHLKQDNPQVSFPAEVSDELLAEYGVYEVKQTPIPAFTYKNNMVESEPVNNNGVWEQSWIITDKPVEETSAMQESFRREAYLNESDPLFFKWQRGEIDKQVWLDKVAEIKQRWI